jgi:uncharacterized membrane protein
MRRTLPLLLLLGACQPQAPEGEAAQRPLDAPPPAAAAPAAPVVSDFGQPLRALGTEPFWAVEVTDGTRLVLKRPDHPDAMFEAPGATISPGRAVWTARAADARTMTLTLFVSDCSDGMSDRRYPMTAEVELNGETLRGCAIPTAELAKAPRP